MTAAIDSVISFTGAADPTALASSASGAGISFADICTAQLSAAEATHASVPKPTSDPSTTENTTASVSPAPTKSLAKDLAKETPGSNSVLAFLIAIPIVPVIQLDPAMSSPSQPVGSLSLDDSQNALTSGSDGAIPSAPFAPALGSANAAASMPSNVPIVSGDFPGLAGADNPSPKMLASAGAAVQESWPLTAPVEGTPASAGAAASSLPSLASEAEAQSPKTESTLNDASADPEFPDVPSGASQSLGLNASTSSPDLTTASASEISSFNTDVQPPRIPLDGEHESLCQVSVAQTFHVAEKITSQDEFSENAIQAAENQPYESEQTRSTEQRRPERSATPGRSSFDVETSRASSTPATTSLEALRAGFAETATIFASDDTPQRTHADASAVPAPVPAHGNSGGASATLTTTNLKTTSIAENSFAASTTADAGATANAAASASAAKDLAITAASPSSAQSTCSSGSSSKKDPGSKQSDSQQPNNSSSNGAVAHVAATAVSPALASAAASAQANVSQTSSSPDIGAKSNAQTPAGNSSNMPRSSLTVDTPATTAASPLQWAQMANKAGQAEMRIGVNTAEFGSVEVRTCVHASDVGVQIGSEKGDLRSLLTPDLPNIAHTLQQQDLRLTQVSFHQQGFAFAGNSSFSGGNSQPSWYSSKPRAASSLGDESSAAEPSHASEPITSQRGHGLSILA